MIARRQAFLSAVAAVPARDLVFVDECGVSTAMTRPYGRAPRGQRAHGHAPHGHWQVLTVLGALTIAGPLAAMTINAATDAAVFQAYVGQVLAPRLQPGQIVVMDNLGARKVAGVRKAIEAVGCRVLYLPPYSPGLNPIEMAWSKLKSWLRTAALREVDQLERGIGAGLRTITARDARRFVRHCGYAL